MTRIPGILFVLIYSVGTLICPFQDYGALKSLPQVYDQCKEEDPDMDAADFIFEHLMNLGCILSVFDHDTDKNEKPHQPLQSLHAISQTLVVAGHHIAIGSRPTQEFNVRQDYAVQRIDFIPSGFLSRVFRPPAV